MRRPYPLFLLAVVAPAAAAAVGGSRLVESAWVEVVRASQARAGRMALAALQQDLGATAEDLLERVEPWPEPDPADPLATRAATGDTVQGLVPGPGGMEIRVAVPGAPSDPPGTVRVAAAPLPASVTRTLALAGFPAALYVNGRRWDASQPPPGPEELDAATLHTLGRAPEGLPLPSGGGAGSGALLVPHRAGGALSPSLTALVGAPRDAYPLLPRPLLLVTTLALAFAAVAGWIQLSGRRAVASPGWVAALSLVPALTAWAFLLHAHRLFEEGADAALRRDLGRAMAVAFQRGSASDPHALRAITGYHAVHVRDGAVRETTLDGDLSAVAALRPPPPNFNAAGRVPTPEGPSAYVAQRLDEGDFMVATTRLGAQGGRELGRRLVGIGLALTGWLAAAGAWAARRRRAVSS